MNKWQLSWKEEQAFKDKKAREIAAQFKEGKIVLNPVREHNENSGLFDYLDLGDEARIHIGFDLRKERVLISGYWPRTKTRGGEVIIPRDALAHQEANPYSKITIDWNKPLEQIKRDIDRRFLPGYLAVLKRCKEIRDKRDQGNEEQDRNVQEIARLANGRVSPHGDKNAVYAKNADYTIHGTSVSIKVNYIPVEQAKKVAAFLRCLAEAESEVEA